MIEFQLTIYMCSHCTRVHNAAQECLQHELSEHTAKIVSTPEPVLQPTTQHQSTPSAFSPNATPFTITDDVKPNVDEVQVEEEPPIVAMSINRRKQNLSKLSFLPIVQPSTSTEADTNGIQPQLRKRRRFTGWKDLS